MPLPSANQRRDLLLVGGVAALASLAAFLYYYRQDAILLYGDTVAHIHIARRVVDSLTPGPFRLGTVWLPLPHILTVPFVISDRMWRSGAGGSMVSMMAYVAGTLGIFRLVRGRASRGAAWLAAVIYGSNPNLLYLQATAMTEPLYLALFIWTVTCLDAAVLRWRAGEVAAAARSLEACAIVLAGALLTRYDGWWLAGCVLATAGGVTLRWMLGRERQVQGYLSGLQYRGLRRALRNGVLLLAAVPLLWLAYNYREYGNPLEFATGPYSARAIEQRTLSASFPTYPGQYRPRVATIYLLKCAKLNLGSGRWETALLAAGALGSVLMLAFLRAASAWLLLWVPLPFYIFSIAYGWVPIFLGTWYPFSLYNVRFGLELLPGVAVFAALLFEFLGGLRPGQAWQIGVSVLAVGLVAGSYASVWRTTPICLREATANSRTRIPFEQKLAATLERLPASARLLMYAAQHAGALQRAGVRLRRVIHEDNHPQWEQALADPARSADYVVAVEGDPVAQAVAAHPGGLQAVAKIESPGQPPAIVYRTEHAIRR